MANIGGTEIILILLVALLLFGAKGLPKVARTMGRTVEQFRRAARDVTHEVMNADRDYESPAAPREITGGGQIARSDSDSGYPESHVDTSPTTAADVHVAEATEHAAGGDAATPVSEVAQKGSSDDEGRG